jgi:endonuclease/exonuclease/phosphatase family metal-dependent hydrolase
MLPRSLTTLAGRPPWLLLALVLSTLGNGDQLAAAGSESASTNSLAVMTFNLRYASTNPPHAWPQRRPVVKACIETSAPDLVGTQEGLYQQLKDIAADLPDYEWVGLGRDGGSRGEFMAVFYRRARFEPVEYDHFWLSDTPHVIGSSTWGNTNRRMVTWVRFRDRNTQREFYFWNTHLDHAIQAAREKGAELIRQRVDELKLKLPVVLVGDFNAVAGVNPAYPILVNTNGFTDSWVVARERRQESINSFHNFEGPKPGGQRIDWILFRGAFTVDSAEIVTFTQNGQYPSDHFPVLAILQIPSQ